MPTKSANAERLNDKAVAGLFKDIEQVTGRLLEAKEPEAVAAWIREYGIDPEVILAAYSYCVKNRKSSTRYSYVEKILFAWRERGLDTAEKVEEYLADTDRKYDFYRKVFKALGFRRNPTEAEADVMDSWTEDLGCSLEDVLEACRKTSGISNPSVNYIDAVLRDVMNKRGLGAAEENAKLQRAVEDRYEIIRNANARKTEALREKIYADVPRLREISDDSVSLSIKISRLILRGASGKEELREARDKQSSMQSEKKKLLEENGYKADALDPVYTCARCHDTGSLEDGTRCSCYLDRLREVQNEQ